MAKLFFFLWWGKEMCTETEDLRHTQCQDFEMPVSSRADTRQNLFTLLQIRMFKLE